MTKKVTKRVGRPNIAKEEKKQNVTIRVYKDDQKLIRSKFGSFQRFFDDRINSVKEFDAIFNKKEKSE